MDISKIDSNFKIDTKIGKSDIKFYDIKNENFKIYGVIIENGRYRRFPESVAKTVSEGVLSVHDHTAGGRVLFKTDSPYIAIHAKMPHTGKMPHFALTGSVGFDLYERVNGTQHYINTFVPPFDVSSGYESVIDLSDDGMREYVINFPLYSGVEDLYIGISECAKIMPPEPYKGEKPIVYYGSSITQGGCASRPGNSYQAIISRKLNRDYINLGFSGNAKGEDEIADYIKDLPMSFFVYDYDHNAPSAEHLKNTHERMFKKIRNTNPDLPILLLTRPKFRLTPDEIVRQKIIFETYQNALNAGDKNVYFLAGNEMIDEDFEEVATVDHCHPNDCGFYIMAQKIGEVIEKNIR